MSTSMNLPENARMLTRMPDRTPQNGTFELTVRCNLRCKMCLFRHDDSENAAIMDKELTAEQWIDMARQVAEAGTLSLLITGGEPMLRPDFCEIWEGIYKQGFIMDLYTNATLVTPRIMETLQKYPPHRIGVTIYGASPETYEKVCGNGAAFERAIAGMHQLKTLPSRMEFRTTIIKDNYPDLDELHKLVEREFDTKRIIHTRLVTKSVRGACADVAACRLEPEDNIRMAFKRGIDIIKDFIGESYDEKNLRLEYRSQDEMNGGKPRVSLFGCEAGMHDYTISWDGKLLGCQMLGLFWEDPLAKGFAKAWKDFPMTVKLPPMNETCLNCESQKYCNCCPASRYAETGALNGCPEYVCRDVAVMKRLLTTGGI